MDDCRRFTPAIIHQNNVDLLLVDNNDKRGLVSVSKVTSSCDGCH